MFRCVVHHPEEELRVLAQNCQHFTSLLEKMWYEVYMYFITHYVKTLYNLTILIKCMKLFLRMVHNTLKHIGEI